MAMGVAAVDDEFFLRRAAHDFQNRVSYRFAREMREPFVVRDLPFVPARIAERRQVRAQDDTRIFGKRLWQHPANVLR